MKEAFSELIMESFGFFPSELLVLLLSAFPVIEVRGGIPAAALLGVSFESALLFALLGNLLPIAPVLLLFRPVSRWLLRFQYYKKFYDWVFERTMKKGAQVQKWGAAGLILFTAVPLPTTGAYSACLAAVLFFIPFRAAFFAISFGVVIATTIIGIASYPLFI
ncbi:COG2426 family protein [Thalassorhabdus alkalitolerans]|uniref:COG2426 family protein n=1 Tax=Thalassorhabdus alkalitolerans TaxID=2282697 RepID=A0ABW0YQY6_9BACI